MAREASQGGRGGPSRRRAAPAPCHPRDSPFPSHPGCSPGHSQRVEDPNPRFPRWSRGITQVISLEPAERLLNRSGQHPAYVAGGWKHHRGSLPGQGP